MEKKQIDWINNLRFISVLAVITVHTVAPYVGDYNCNLDHPSWWHIGNIIDSTVRFCVPVFLMISGMNRLNSIKQTTIRIPILSLRVKFK